MSLTVRIRVVTNEGESHGSIDSSERQFLQILEDVPGVERSSVALSGDRAETSSGWSISASAFVVTNSFEDARERITSALKATNQYQSILVERIST